MRSLKLLTEPEASVAKKMKQSGTSPAALKRVVTRQSAVFSDCARFSTQTRWGKHCRSYTSTSGWIGFQLFLTHGHDSVHERLECQRFSDTEGVDMASMYYIHNAVKCTVRLNEENLPCKGNKGNLVFGDHCYIYLKFKAFPNDWSGRQSVKFHIEANTLWEAPKYLGTLAAVNKTSVSIKNTVFLASRLKEIVFPYTTVSRHKL